MLSRSCQPRPSSSFSSKQAALRDEVDAVLPQLAPRIRDLGIKYAVLAVGPSQTMSDAGPIQLAANDAAATPTPPAAEKSDAAKGKEVFDGTCAHCHGPNAVVADRKINLRLLQRKHGEQMSEVFFTTVTNGRPAKGMPAWKDVFKQQDFVNILAYLNTVQDK